MGALSGLTALTGLKCYRCSWGRVCRYPATCGMPQGHERSMGNATAGVCRSKQGDAFVGPRPACWAHLGRPLPAPWPCRCHSVTKVEVVEQLREALPHLASVSLRE